MIMRLDSLELTGGFNLIFFVTIHLVGSTRFLKSCKFFFYSTSFNYGLDSFVD